MYLDVNDTRLYYELSGKGAPMILLHGNGEDHTIFSVLITELSENFSVYAVDSRGHGQSAKAEKFDYNIMACDIYEFIKKLELDKPILYGFSDGGILGLILASEYPDVLSRLIVSGANTNPDGVRALFTLITKLTFMLTKSERIKLMLTQPDIKKLDLNRICIPTLVLAGSRDLIKQKHTEYLADNIPGSRLHILKGEGHGSYIIRSPKLYNIIKPFLNEYI